MLGHLTNGSTLIALLITSRRKLGTGGGWDRMNHFLLLLATTRNWGEEVWEGRRGSHTTEGEGVVGRGKRWDGVGGSCSLN